MKALRIILYTLTVALLLFLSLGILFPSYEYQSSIVVRAAPEKCWEVFHDTIKMSEWLEVFESLTLKSGEPLSTGSMYELVVNDEGHRMVMSEKIKEVTAPVSASFELDNDVLKSEYSFAFKGTTSTTITSHYKITGNNILWKSILFLSKSYMVNAAQQQLEALKKVIEKP